METISAYILAMITALALLLIALVISLSINFEKGVNPKDKLKRKVTFWSIAALSPILILLLGLFVFMPDANQLIVKRYTNAIFVASAVGLILYILIGFVLSRIYKHGKLGHWF